MFDFLLAKLLDLAVPFVSPLHGPLKDSRGLGGDFGRAGGTPVLHVRRVRGHGSLNFGGCKSWEGRGQGEEKNTQSSQTSKYIYTFENHDVLGNVPL